MYHAYWTIYNYIFSLMVVFTFQSFQVITVRKSKCDFFTLFYDISEHDQIYSFKHMEPCLRLCNFFQHNSTFLLKGSLNYMKIKWPKLTSQKSCIILPAVFSGLIWFLLTGNISEYQEHHWESTRFRIVCYKTRKQIGQENKIYKIMRNH